MSNIFTIGDDCYAIIRVEPPSGRSSRVQGFKSSNGSSFDELRNHGSVIQPAQEPGSSGYSGCSGQAGFSGLRQRLRDKLAPSSPLLSPEAIGMFQTLVRHGYLTPQLQPVQPCFPRRLQAYTAESIAIRLKLTHTPWKDFGILFGVKGLHRYKYRTQNIGLLPSDYDKIDELLK